MMASSSHSRSSTNSSGYEPSINCSRWVFNEDISRKKGRVYGPYESMFREKIDTLPRPYKEIVTTKPCLPSIKSDCMKTPSEPSRRGPIFTRYTSSQHKRQEAGQSIEEQIYEPIGLFNQFKDKIDSFKHNLLWAHLKKIKSKNREESQKALEGLARLLEAGFYGRSSESSWSGRKSLDRDGSLCLRDTKSKMNSEDLAAMIEVKQKNVYIYHAKPPRPVREQQAGLIQRKKKKKNKEEEENPWGDPEQLRLKEVLQDYIEWAFELGGGTAIDEHTLRCLFSSGYDTVPSISVPIVLIKNEDLPVGLRESSVIPPPSSQTSADKSTAPASKKRPKKVYTGKNDFRYGAWYLNPKSWTKIRKGEKMIDPEHLEIMQNTTGIEMRKRELAENLSQMYITNAFYEFIKAKDARQPVFLIEAMNIRKEQKKREKEKAEAEERAKQEYLLKQIK